MHIAGDAPSTEGILLGVCVFGVWLGCLLLLRITQSISRRFGVSRFWTLLYILEIAAAVAASVIILSPILNFHFNLG